MDLRRFRRLPLLGILRGIRGNDVSPLADVVAEGGLEAIEITMNTADAAVLIRRMVAASRDRFMVGAGTVLTVQQLEEAVNAGATFAVMPTLVADVVESCVTRGTPVFPGALTPLEIFNAWKAGATMVKVFPAGSFGPGYLREIKGPFADIELLACGGVTAHNMSSYFAAGASAVAFGASVFRPEWLQSGSYDRIRSEIKKLVDACKHTTSNR
jgi:2-dehydro-3-deoxyphosphogluconate aldolase/(4S)-4-hydroxy-2-oxoglutarate aldolase